MKFKKIFILTFILFAILTVKSTVSAKYVYNYTEKVAELEIDRTAPIITIEYSTKEPTNQNVIVKIISNEEVREVSGWTLLEDRKTLIKEYEKNEIEIVDIKDLSGNTIQEKIEINNIDKISPEAEILEITNHNYRYERYANKAHEIKTKIKIYDNNNLIENFSDFEILVGNTLSNCTKEITVIEKMENYIIYEVELTNILEEGNLQIKIKENSFSDLAGNVIKETILDLGILIDNTAPEVSFIQEKNINGKILAKISSNEEIRKENGWLMSLDQKVISKEFISDIKYKKQVQDFAGNIASVDINIKGSQYLGLKTIAHISNMGWVKEDTNYIGANRLDNRYKIEGLIIRTGENVEKDFLRASAFVYTYWGEGTSAISNEFNVKYDYGYNPKDGYKTMEKSQLVNYEEEEYIHLGAEGINFHGTTDINGNNPIPEDIASEHRYGISGISFDLKDNSENSIIYQVFIDNVGWTKTCKNGEEAMIAHDKTIGAMRIAVVPTSEVNQIIEQWNLN